MLVRLVHTNHTDRCFILLFMHSRYLKTPYQGEWEGVPRRYLKVTTLCLLVKDKSVITK